MDDIVRRLKESRDIEVAKSILESAGYKVTKRLNESANTVRKVLMDLNIPYEDISEEDDVVYVSREKPYSHQELNKVWDKLHGADGSGFEDGRRTMWFSFS